MPAGEYNLEIEQGTTFSLVATLTVSDVAMNLTGYTGAAQIRQNYFSAPTPITVSIPAPATGAVSLSLTAKQTRDIPYTKGLWDFELTDGSGVVTRILKGVATISHEVTR